MTILDNYFNALRNMPQKIVLTASACLLTIGAFLYKMRVVRVIPNFLIPNPTQLNVNRHVVYVIQHTNVVPPSDWLHMPPT